MDEQCKKCSADIDMMKGLYTVCEGSCARKFHASCVNVSEADLCALSKNIIWMCDDCMLEFCRARDRIPNSKPKPSDSISTELEEIKSQIATINSVVAKLTPIAPFDSTHRHSTPNGSPKSLDNTNACSTYHYPRHSPEDSFALLLTNIDKRVTEKEIVCLVSESLCAPQPECMDVTKLVSNWKNCEDLDYISFKIVLHNRWKLSAMEASTWPREVKFREFTRKKNATWKPISLRNLTV